MSIAPVIHICGWPGSGKRTIAMELRDQIGARLIDNHLILNPASALFDRGTAQRSALRERLRAVIYDAALGLPKDVPIILTDAVAQTDAESPLVVPMLDFVAARCAQLIPFVLAIEANENRRRLSDPARIGSGKLTDADVLDDLRSRHSLLHLPEARVLDVTHLTANAAACALAAEIAASRSAQ